MAGHRHPESVEDEQALRNFRQGCQDCFALLFWRYCRAVAGIALKILQDRAEAEDILQEVFLTIFQRPERFDPDKGSFRTWVLQLGYYRSLMRRRYLSSRTPEEPAGEDAGCAQDPFLACLVERGLASISPSQRRALELVHFEGYTLRETSELCGQSLANTRNNYYRGLKALRAFLTGGGATQSREPAATVPLPDASHAQP